MATRHRLTLRAPKPISAAVRRRTLFSDDKAVRVYAIATNVLFVASVILAASFTPGYPLFTQWISDLGVGGGAVFFNVGLMLTALVLFLFYASLTLTSGHARHASLASSLGAAGALALYGVAALPETAGWPHVLASMSFFLLAGLSVLSFTLGTLREKRLNESILGTGVLFILVDLLFGLATFGRVDAAWAVPLEWAAVGTFGLWLLAIGFTLHARAAPARA